MNFPRRLSDAPPPSFNLKLRELDGLKPSARPQTGKTLPGAPKSTVQESKARDLGALGKLSPRQPTAAAHKPAQAHKKEEAAAHSPSMMAMPNADEWLASMAHLPIKDDPPVSTPALAEGKAAEEKAEVAPEAETATPPTPERLSTGYKAADSVLNGLRKINPVLSRTLSKIEEARADPNGGSLVMAGLKGYGGALIDAGKGAMNAVSTVESMGGGALIANPIGLAVAAGTGAYLGASQKSDDALGLVKTAGKLV